MYKDKQKQREAAKAAVERFRAKQGITEKVLQPEGITNVIPNVPANYGQPDCACKHCQSMRSNGLFAKGYTLNHRTPKTGQELGGMAFNRQTLPGDIDYIGAGQKPTLTELYKAKIDQEIK